MNVSTLTHLARVLAEHVLPTLDNHGIRPALVDLRIPEPEHQALLRDCRDAHGASWDLSRPVAVPDAVLRVLLLPRDWSRMFCPVMPGARHEVIRPVDICDPAVSEYCMDHRLTLEGGRWVVARTSGPELWRKFSAMDGAHPGVVWETANGHAGTYADLEAELIAWETCEDRHHLPG